VYGHFPGGSYGQYYAPAGLLSGHDDSTNTDVWYYCLNYWPILNTSRHYYDAFYEGSQQILYILANFSPNAGVPGGVAGIDEWAAIQGAIWHYTDGYWLDYGRTSYVHNRFVQIVQTADNAIAGGWRFWPAGGEFRQNTDPPGTINIPYRNWENIWITVVDSNGRATLPNTPVNYWITNQNGTGAYFTNCGCTGFTSWSDGGSNAWATVAVTSCGGASFTVEAQMAGTGWHDPALGIGGGNQNLVVANYTGIPSQNPNITVWYTIPVTCSPYPGMSQAVYDSRTGQYSSTQVSAAPGDAIRFDMAPTNVGWAPLWSGSYIQTDLSGANGDEMNLLANFSAANPYNAAMSGTVNAPSYARWNVGPMPAQTFCCNGAWYAYLYATIPATLDTPSTVNSYDICNEPVFYSNWSVTPPPACASVTYTPGYTVSKSVSLAQAPPGTSLQYTLTVHSTGDRNIPAGATLTDTVDTAKLSAPTNISSGGVYNATTHQIVWSLPDLPSGTSEAVSFTSSILSSTSPPTSVQDTAILSSPLLAPAPSNTVNTNIVCPTPAPQLSGRAGSPGGTITVTPAEVPSGGTATYRILATNIGTDAMSRVAVTLTVPNPYVVQSATGGSVSGGTVTFALGTLTPGQSDPLVVTVSAPSGGASPGNAGGPFPGSSPVPGGWVLTAIASATMTGYEGSYSGCSAISASTSASGQNLVYSWSSE